MVCNPPQQNGNAIRLATLRMQIDKRQLILSICSYHRTRSSGLTLPKKKQAPPIRKKKYIKKVQKETSLPRLARMTLVQCSLRTGFPFTQEREASLACSYHYLRGQCRRHQAWSCVAQKLAITLVCCGYDSNSRQGLIDIELPYFRCRGRYFLQYLITAPTPLS